MAAGLQQRRAALQGLRWTLLDLPDWFPSRTPLEGARPAELAEPVRWAVPGVWDSQPTPDKVVPCVGELVEQLSDLVAQVAAIDPTLLPPGQALGEAAALEQVLHQLRLARLARTEDVRARKLYEHQGFWNQSAWQRTVSPDAPVKDASLARALPGLPTLASALRERRVAFAAAHKVKSALGKVRLVLDRPDGMIDGQPGEPVVEAVVWNVVDLVCKDRFGLTADPKEDPAQAAVLAELEALAQATLDAGGSQRARVEAAMVLLATELHPDSLGDGLSEIVDQLIPSALELRDKDAQDKRALALSPNSDGTWHLEGTLTPEVGEQIFTALAAEARRDPANPIDTKAREQARLAAAEAEGKDGWVAAQDRPEWEDRALREHGLGLDDAAQQLVPRTRSKRLHDALGRLLTRYLEGGLGGLSGKVPVQATVTISARTIEGAPGAPPARGASSRPLAPSLIQRWWCNSHVTVLLMSQGWKPLGVVHRGRTITGTEMTAARVQFNNRCPGIGCCPGKPDPLIPLVPHHIDMYSKTGQTSLSTNLMPCPTLHQDIHLGGKPIRLRDGRLITEDGYLLDPP
jgi:hypothetical protein